MDLAGQVLEEALQLVQRAVGGGQELHRVVLGALERAYVLELGDQLATEALHPAARQHRVATLEAKADPVSLPEHPRGEGARRIAEPERQVDGAAARREALLSHHREAPLEPLAGAKLRDLRTDRCDGGLHPTDVEPAPGR